ncbi:hypothetical protein DICPUDRAFT_100058 [Dictyostelium purpureum]|uniref:DUF2804 domain-containing protein n=1 Tax=Dictyostelium purpureum TaxID=5786 RepID=F1A535_DICPU|nr:uncharacterized protein DICPUDRAFT_100058 [Dictyostelium purpureum]EGC28694.1 hypothetical protein DICPUDRAFT_100058 [Dictyostelium purpureum]|eukprot:XP_003294779.1 hypothetical protein DICPUDRAFT_100058 [Dictyostelium purpureum]
MSSHISFQDEDLNNQVEIKESDELLDGNGSLKNRGWSRQPCLKYNPGSLSRFRKAYRLKEWNYYSIGSKNFYFAVAAIDLGYVNNYQTFFIDFTEDLEMKNNGTSTSSSSPSSSQSKKNNYIMDDVLSTAALTKGLCLPADSCQSGIHTKYESKNFRIEFTVDDQSKHHIKINSKKINLNGDLVFDLNPQRESVVLVTPIGKDNFYYNRKTNLIPVSGTLTVDGKEMITPENDCHGIMDWGRGCWDYNSFWLWSSAWGRTKDKNTPIGLNFGSGFGNLSTHTENAINLDGVIHKLGHVDIQYNEDNLLEPWKFTCKHGRFGENPLIFTPFKKKFDNNNFGIVMSNFHQILGKFTGEILLDNGERVEIDIIGFTEVHKARW